MERDQSGNEERLGRLVERLGLASLVSLGSSALFLEQLVSPERQVGLLVAAAAVAGSAALYGFRQVLEAGSIILSERSDEEQSRAH